MKIKTASAPPKRRYRQSARAQAAEETAARILDAFRTAFQTDWYDAITLERIARDADVTVPTVVRRFGGKDGMLEAVAAQLGDEIRARREVAAGDVEGVVRLVEEDYEQTGDLVMRLLAQEERFEALKTHADIGRAVHRAWIEAAFAPWLDPLAPADRRRRLDALVVATDLYTWKLARRDMGRSRAEVRRLMLTLISGSINAPHGAPQPTEDKDG